MMTPVFLRLCWVNTKFQFSFSKHCPSSFVLGACPDVDSRLSHDFQPAGPRYPTHGNAVCDLTLQLALRHCGVPVVLVTECATQNSFRIL